MTRLRADDPVVATIIGKLDALLDELGDILRAAHGMEPKAKTAPAKASKAAASTSKGKANE